ncbi:hypothetical protein [Streptomyces virginiae]|uniref:hypothetical protein n=1 Tax=Streptomyces virginiae TaxID=1961 RepID=UPI0036FD8AE1
MTIAVTGPVRSRFSGGSAGAALYDHHVAQLLDQALFHVEHLRMGLRDTPPATAVPADA